VNPVAFLDIAEHFQASSSEAERRTSIGRSYYALYNIIFVSLSSQGVNFNRSGDDHARLVYYLIRCGHPRAADIGATLRDLRGYRNNADYQMNAIIDGSQSQLVYGKARGAVVIFREIQQTDLPSVVQRIKALPPYNPSRRR
jgi:hypothetical protein